jgi:hypothetical protein
MWFSRWLRPLKRGLPSRPRRSSPRPAAVRCRPNLEQLEDRTLLAAPLTYTATTGPNQFVLKEDGSGNLEILDNSSVVAGPTPVARPRWEQSAG